jgi:hypothetical protein
VLILLMAGTFIALFLILLGENEPGEGLPAVGGSFLRAAVILGAYLTISSEALSPLNGLTQSGVALAWLLPALVLFYLGWSRRSLRRGLKRLGLFLGRIGLAERWVLGAVGLVAGVLLAVAWMSPPNNVDSLLYHMSRVVHWAQNHSLRHYATSYNHQLLMPIWAETAILHLRLLWGTVRLANLVQWSSMIGCVFGTVALAASLGGTRTGLLLTAAFVITIPMGILQSTSTQNDYVVAFWAVCTAYLVTQAALRPPPLIDKICLAMALGIGFLTKATFYVYAPALILWFFLVRWKQIGLGKMILEGILLAAMVVILNFGFWSRNIATYGGPYGSSEWLQDNLWLRLPLPSHGGGGGLSTGATAIGFRPGESADAGRLDEGPTSPWAADLGDVARVASISPDAGTRFAEFLVRLTRTAAFNLVTPVAFLNEAIVGGMRHLPAVFDSRYVDRWEMAAWNHEDTASSPLHFGLILASMVVLSVRQESPAGLWRKYVVAVVMSYLLLPIIINHAPSSIYAIRYQLPFFVLSGPIVGQAGSTLRNRTAAGVLAGLLFLSAVPLLLFNNTRPLIGRTPWPTRVGSILTTSPTRILLAVNQALEASYVEGTDLVRESGCTQVGLRIDSGDLEYAFWWLLGAPESGLRIESIYPTDDSRSLADPAFRPCAILCTICGDRQRLHGLPLEADFGAVDVFVGPGYVADPDG